MIDTDIDLKKVKDEISSRVYNLHQDILALISFSQTHSPATDKGHIAAELFLSYCEKVLGALAMQCSPDAKSSSADIPLANARANLMLEILSMPPEEFRATFEI